jgi:hypothetical protein
MKNSVIGGRRLGFDSGPSGYHALRPTGSVSRAYLSAIVCDACAVSHRD